MAKIDSLKNKNGDIIYPKTLEKAIYDNDGVRLDNKLNNFVDNSRVLTDVPADAKFTDTKYEAGENIEIVGNTINSLGGGDKVVEMGDSDIIDLSLGNIFISRPVTDKEYSIVNAGDGYNEFKLYIITGEESINVKYTNNITHNFMYFNIKKLSIVFDKFISMGGVFWYNKTNEATRINHKSYYVLATDDDFSGERDGQFRYIGNDEYVIIPKVIKGVTVTSAGSGNTNQNGAWVMNHSLFKGKSLKGVATQEGHSITNMTAMFDSVKSDNLDLSNLDTSNVTNMNGMFYSAKIETIEAFGLFTMDKVSSTTKMFDSAVGITGYVNKESDISKLTGKFEVKPFGLNYVITSLI